MASSTTNLDLILPVGGENVSRQIINANNVKIDEAVGPVPSGTDLQSQVTALNNNMLKQVMYGDGCDFDNFEVNTIARVGASSVVHGPGGLTTFVGDVITLAPSTHSTKYITQKAYTQSTRGFTEYGRIKIGSGNWSSWEELALKSKYYVELPSANFSLKLTVNTTNTFAKVSGMTVELYIEATTNDSIAAWELLMNELPSSIRPSATNNAFSFTVGSATKMCNLNSSGTWNAPEAIASGTNIRFHTVYLL